MLASFDVFVENLTAKIHARTAWQQLRRDSGSALHAVRAGPRIAATVSAGMTARSSLFAETGIANYDFSRFGTMVDVGGGRGFLLATLAKNPRLPGTLVDMPRIIAAARPPQAKRAAARWNAVAGDFFHHVPEGAASKYSLAYFTTGRANRREGYWTCAARRCGPIPGC